MTKVLDATLLAHYQKSVTSRTKLLKITRKDGQVFPFNGFNRDLTYDDLSGGGAIIYRAARGASVSALLQEIGFKPDTFDITFLIDDTVITTDDMVGGKFDGADYVLYEVNWSDLTAGRHLIPEGGRGKLGTVTVEGADGRVEMRPLSDAILTQRGRKVTRKCVALFGEPLLCGVRLEVGLWAALTAVTETDPRNARAGSIVRSLLHPDRYFENVTAGTTDASEPTFDPVLGNITTETGGVQWRAERAYKISVTVDVVTNQRVFSIVTATDAPDDFLKRGHVKGTSGANLGVEMDIKGWDLASRTLSLAIPLEFAVVSGDGFDVFAGCRKRRVDCKGRRNIRNAKAFYNVPGNDEAFKIVRASS